MKTDPLQTVKCVNTKNMGKKWNLKMSYKIIIDSKNEISLPPFIPGTHQISTLKIMSCLEIFQTFPSAPPKKKHPRPTNPNHKRLFQGAHRLQHHGLFRGWMEFFWEWEDLLWKLKTKRLQMFRRRSLFFWKKNSPNHKWCLFFRFKNPPKSCRPKKGTAVQHSPSVEVAPFQLHYLWLDL